MSLLKSLKKILGNECNKKNYQAIIAVELDKGKCFTISTGTLNDDAPFGAWKGIVTGIGMQYMHLEKNFTTTRVNISPPPIQQK